MSDLQLLKENTFYRQVKTTSEGRYVGSVWLDGDITLSYTPFEGMYESFRQGQSAIILPEGVSSTDAIWLSSHTILKTSNDLIGNASLADKITLLNPDVYPDTPVFVIWHVEPWDDAGFELLTPHHDYIAIREEKL